MSGKITRSDMWRKQYREDRYAEHFSRIELNKRIRDIVLNMTVLRENGLIGIPSLEEGGARWMELWTHTLEEMAFRYGPYPNGWERDILHSEPFPELGTEKAQKAATAVRNLKLGRKSIFAKFGKLEYMEALHRRGAIRIQPASFFSRPDHNGAVRDDELNLDVSLNLDRESVLKLVVNPEDVPARLHSHRVDLRYTSPTDYWLYCVSTLWTPRLFVDFSAEACVIIRDRTRFVRLIEEAAAKPLNPAKFDHGKAVYIDPCMPGSRPIFVPFAKPFGYSYQEEYRFCWVPETPTEKLQHVDIELGSLEEFTELVVL